MANGKKMRGASLNATFGILMAKYKEGRAGVRGHKN
jgi:hypothetical protein